MFNQPKLDYFYNLPTDSDPNVIPLRGGQGTANGVITHFRVVGNVPKQEKKFPNAITKCRDNLFLGCYLFICIYIGVSCIFRKHICMIQCIIYTTCINNV